MFTAEEHLPVAQERILRRWGQSPTPGVYVPRGHQQFEIMEILHINCAEVASFLGHYGEF